MRGVIMNWVTIKKFSSLSGYTEKAVRNKINRGIWINKKHWEKAPDGRILICIKAIEEWYLGG